MNEDDKNPKKAFNEKAPEQQNIRDQDNADKEYTPPNNDSQPRSNAAPRGMSGIKTGKEHQQQIYDVELELDPLIEKSDMDWHRIINGNFDQSEDLKGYSFELTLNEDKKAETIEGSNIEQLDLRKDGLLISRFDKDHWEHESLLLEAREAIERLKEKFPEQKKEFKSFADMNPDDGNDIDL